MENKSIGFIFAVLLLLLSSIMLKRFGRTFIKTLCCGCYTYYYSLNFNTLNIIDLAFRVCVSNTIIFRQYWYY